MQLFLLQQELEHLQTVECPILLCIGFLHFTEATSTKAVDSLFILGANGILTEHILIPQKAEGAPEGDDAPIELHHKPVLEWNLLR